MLFCGIPIFFQEVAIGQYLGAGGMSLVGQLCPLLQGIYFYSSTLYIFKAEIYVKRSNNYDMLLSKHVS